MFSGVCAKAMSGLNWQFAAPTKDCGMRNLKASLGMIQTRRYGFRPVLSNSWVTPTTSFQIYSKLGQSVCTQTTRSECFRLCGITLSAENRTILNIDCERSPASIAGFPRGAKASGTSKGDCFECRDRYATLPHPNRIKRNSSKARRLALLGGKCSGYYYSQRY